jgi:hypothetical protein
MDIWMKTAVLLGWIVIIALSCDDFRKNVRKSKHRWQYYLAGAIFVTINAFAYMVLIQIVLQTSAYKLLFDDIPLEGDGLRLLVPLIVSVVYFGAGAGTFKLGSKEIQLNQRLLDLLQNMFSYHRLVAQDVSYSNAVAEETFKQLRQRAEALRNQSEFNKWDPLDVDWKAYSEDEGLLSAQVDYLEAIGKDLDQLCDRLPEDETAAAQLADVIKRVRQRVGDLRRSLIHKLQKYLVAFAFGNFKDDAQLEAFLVEIDVLDDGTDGGGSHLPCIITRGLVIGFMFGLLFGPVFSIFKLGDATHYSFLGATALMLFTGFISIGISTARWGAAAIWAATGGYLSHFYWIITRSWLAGSIDALAIDVNFWLRPMVGLSYGVVTALLLFWLKYRFGRRFKGRAIRNVSAALVGVLAYPTVYGLLFFNKLTLTGALVSGVIGAIVMLGMALSVNVNVASVGVERGKMPRLQLQTG